MGEGGSERMLRYAREALERLDEQAASLATLEGGIEDGGVVEEEEEVPTAVARANALRTRGRWTRQETQQTVEDLLVRWESAKMREKQDHHEEEKRARRREAEAQQMRNQAAQMRREARAEQLACGEARSNRNATASMARARARELEQEIQDGAEATKDAQKRTEWRDQTRVRLEEEARTMQVRLSELQRKKEEVSERWKRSVQADGIPTEEHGKEGEATHEAKVEAWKRRRDRRMEELERIQHERREPTSPGSRDAAKRRVANALEQERAAKATRADALRREVEALRMAVREATNKRDEARRNAPSTFPPPPGRIGQQETSKDVLMSCVKAARRSAAVRLSALTYLFALHGMALVLLAWRL